MGDNGSSYSKIESIWSNAVRLTRSVYPNLQDEIEYIEANLGGGNISCNCSALEFAIENLSTIKLSRDGSQPMEGELVCNNGLKTDIIKARTQSIIDCQNQLRVYQSLGGDGDSGLWLGSDFSFGAPSINLYPYSSSANGKIFIRTPRSSGFSGVRVEIPGKNDFIDIKIKDSNLIPYDDNYQDLGSSSKRWKNIYAVSGNFSGVIIPDEIISNADDIANLSLIKLSRDGSQPMTGILTCQSGIKTNSLTTVSGDIVTCEKDLIVNSHIWGNPLLTIGGGGGFTEGYSHIKFSYNDLILLTPGESGPLERIFIYGGWDDGEIMIKNADLAPFTDNRWDLGFPGYTWRCVYAAKGNFSGTIIPDAILTNSANISDLDARVDYLEENLSTCNCSALQFGIDSNTTEIANLSTIKLSRDGSQTMTGLLQCESGLKTDTIDSYSGDTVECSDDLKVNGDILGDSANGLMLKAEDIFAPATIELTSGTAGKIIMSTGTPQPALLPRLEIPWGPGFVDITVSYAHVIPDIDNQQNLGSPSKRWENVYAGFVYSSNISSLEARVEYLENIIGKMGGRGGYSAIVYKDNGVIYAKNPNGDIIAQGTAGTNDASIIQSALNSLTDSRSWREKVICIGNFIMESTISVPSYAILDIRGRFSKEGGKVLDLTNVSNVEIIGGILDTTYNNGIGGRGICVDSSSDLQIYGVYCIVDSGSGGSDSFGIILEHTTDANIINCRVKTNDPTKTARSKAFNPSTDTTKRIKFVNCHAEGTDKSGTGWEIDDGPSDIFLISCSAENVQRGIDMHTHGGGRPPAHNVMIVNFKVYNTEGDAIYIRGSSGTGEQGHDIYLENIIIDSAGGRGIWADYINNITILGGLIKAPTEYGIYTSNCNYKVHVEGVRVVNGGSWGIYLESGGTVVNCEVDSCTGGFWGVGRTQFIGCLATSNSGRGFYARDKPSITSCTSQDNGEDGIRLYSSSRGANIIGCYIYNNDNHGIYVYDTANHVRIIGNFIDSSGKAQILSSGSSGHNVIAFNHIGTDYGWSYPVLKAASDVVKFNRNYASDAFKATSQSVEVGVSNSYGSATDIKSRSGMISSLDVCRIVIGGTLAGGENITVKVETIWESGETESVEKTYTSTGTYFLDCDGQDGLDLWRNSDTCTLIKLYAKSDESSTSATVTCDISGAA